MRLAASARPVAPDPLSPTLTASPRDDALRVDPAVSYRRAEAATPAGQPERGVISVQLGRPVRGRIAVTHRCVYGLPTVVRVAPRLADGTPFPTVFWLTCPVARRHVGELESNSTMAAVNRRLNTDAQLSSGYAAAAGRYVAFRDRLGAPLPGDPGAGGMPVGISCLHAQEAHFLATGDNPVGALTHQALSPMPCPGPCVDDDTLADAYGPGPPPGAVPTAWEAAAPPSQRPHAAGRRAHQNPGGPSHNPPGRHGRARAEDDPQGSRR